MTLRARILLAFLALVSLLALVGLVSVRINTRIQERVARLHPPSMLDLEHEDLRGAGVEVEGAWTRAKIFAAGRVERLPVGRRPKLRGVIDAADSTARMLTMYGIPIHIGPETQLLDAHPRRAWRELEPGARAEISCRIDDSGQWIARKVKLHGVKPSDKIKGTIGRIRIVQGGVDTLVVCGIPVSMRKPSGVEQRSHLVRIRQSSQMTVDLQLLRTALADLIEEAESLQGPLEHPAQRSPAGAEPLDPMDAGAEGSAALRIARALAALHNAVRESQASLATSPPLDDGSADRGSDGIELQDGLRTLADKLPRLDTLTDRVVDLAARSPQRAEAVLSHEVDPFLQLELAPVVQAIRAESEEQLGEEMQTLSAQATATTRLVLATSVVALVLATVLAYLVQRSISRPLRTLRGAALAIAAGRFDARVDGQSRDELGLLAAAFNTMAERLENTTTSVANLEAVQETLRRSLDEKELLLREVHHRVKNNLQVISSLLDLQSRSFREPHVLEKFEESQNRIRSMALIHEQLYGQSRFDRIDVRTYLERLAAHVCDSFGRPAAVRLRLDLRDLHLDLDQALTLGLVANELLSNALKHAFPAGRVGSVRVTLTPDDGSCALSVEDDGVGLPPDFRAEEVRSLGMSLVTMLVRQLHGTLVISGDPGTQVHIHFPLPATAEACAS